MSNIVSDFKVLPNDKVVFSMYDKKRFNELLQVFENLDIEYKDVCFPNVSAIIDNNYAKIIGVYNIMGM